MNYDASPSNLNQSNTSHYTLRNSNNSKYNQKNLAEKFNKILEANPDTVRKEKSVALWKNYRNPVSVYTREAYRSNIESEERINEELRLIEHDKYNSTTSLNLWWPFESFKFWKKPNPCCSARE